MRPLIEISHLEETLSEISTRFDRFMPNETVRGKEHKVEAECIRSGSTKLRSTWKPFYNGKTWSGLSLVFLWSFSGLGLVLGDVSG